jgi:hypothetical protein
MSWVAMMLRVMDKLDVALGSAAPTEFGTAYKSLLEHVDAVKTLNHEP